MTRAEKETLQRIAIAANEAEKATASNEDDIIAESVPEEKGPESILKHFRM